MTYYQGITLEDRSKHLDASVLSADFFKKEDAVIEAYAVTYKMRDSGEM